MKTTYIPTKQVEPEPVKVPYLAHFPGPIIVLVTKINTDKKTAEGYMVSSTSCYKPFEYFSNEWDTTHFASAPVRNGKIIIDFDTKD